MAGEIGAEDLPSDQIYKTALPVILEQLNEPVTSEDLAKKLELAKTQLNQWLKKAVAEGKIKKRTKSVRYQKIDKENTF